MSESVGIAMATFGAVGLTELWDMDWTHYEMILREVKARNE